MEASGNIELGGSIELSGFKDVVDGTSMIVLKKIIGNYVRHYNELIQDFEKLSINLKLVHAIENSAKFEVSSKLVRSGKPVTSEVTDRNLYMAVDSSLKKIESMLK